MTMQGLPFISSLSILTEHHNFQTLRVELEAYPEDGGGSRYAKYSDFRVGDEASKYLLTAQG